MCLDPKHMQVLQTLSHPQFHASLAPPTIFQLIRKQVVTLLLMASHFLAHFWRGAPVLLLHLIGPRSSMGLFLNYHNEVKVHLLIASTHSDLNGHYQNKSGNVLVQKNPVLSVKFVHHTTFWLVSNSILISTSMHIFTPL